MQKIVMKTNYLEYLQGHTYEVANNDAFELIEHGLAELVRSVVKPVRKKTKEMRAGKPKLYVTK